MSRKAVSTVLGDRGNQLHFFARYPKLRGVAFGVLALAGVLAFIPGVGRATLDTPQILSYQGRLTDANKVTIADGAQSMKFVIYDAATLGTCLWSASNTDANTATVDCGAPGTISVTVTDGLFNVLLGDTTGSVQNAFPDSLFNTTSVRYLEITVGGETLTPRRRIVSSATALQAGNASLLDGFDTSQVGGSAAFVPVTDSSGNLVLTRNVTVDTNTLFVDATNDRVGIGTTTPDQKLHVQGTAATGFMVDSSAASADITMYMYNNDGASFRGGFAYDSANTVTSFYGPLSSSRATLHIETDGDVLYTLDAIGAFAAPTITWNGTNDATAGTWTHNASSIASADFIINGDTLANLLFADVSTDRIGIGDSSPAALFTVGSGSAFQVSSSGNLTSPNDVTWTLGGGVDGLNIDSGTLSVDATNDFVGIGTSAPVNKLDVAGSMAIGGAYAGVSAAPTNGLIVAGSVGLGTTTPDAKLEILTEASSEALYLSHFNNSTTANFRFRRARGSEASPTVVVSGDALPSFVWQGYDGNSFENGASIDAYVDGTPGDGDMPTRLVFWTTADGSSALSERMRITNAGNVGIGSTAPGQLLTVGANTFQVSSTGDLVKIDNVAYDWPSSQGGANSILTNDGTGGLSWSTTGQGVVTLQNAYANSTSDPEITLNTSDNDITVQNAVGDTVANFFVFKDGSGTQVARISSAGEFVSGSGTTLYGNLSLTSTNPSYTINVGGSVDIQDIVNVDSLSSDSGVSIASGNAYTGAGAVTLSSGGGAGLTVQSASGAITLGTTTSLTASGSLTVSSGGASALTLDSASNTLVLASSDTTLSRTAAGTFTIDLVNGSATTLSLTNSGAGIASMSLAEAGSYTGAGAVTVSSGAATALTVTSNAAATWGTTAGNLSLIAAGSGTGNVQIGSGAGVTTPDLLVADLKSDAGDPTGTNGAMYYNSNSGKFRCFEGGAWKDCDTTGGTTTLQSAYNNGATITTASSTDIAFTLTSGNFTASGAGSVNLTPTGASSFTSGGALTFTGGAASTWGTSSGNLTLSAAGSSTGHVQIGNATSSTTPDLLVLDNKSDAGDPTGSNGAIYYNASSGLFRIYEGGAWKTLCNKTDQACGTGTGSALSAISAATAGNTISNGDHAQAWNWTLTTASKTAFTFGEDVAATNGVGNQSLVDITTLSTSTAAPIRITNGGTANGLINLTSTGDFVVQDAGTNFVQFLDDGTVTVGKASAASTMNFGVGSGIDTVHIADGTGSDVVTIGQASADVSITDANWSISGAGTGTFGAVTGTGALTVSSGGAGVLTLDSASNTLAIAASDTTLSRTAAGTYTIDLVDGAATTLSLTNSGAGVASMSLAEAGSYTGAGAVTVSAGAGAALTLTSNAAATWSTSSGTLTVDSAAALNLGTSVATSVSLGRTGVTTTNNGSLTSTQTFTASNGMTLTTGALNLTSTSGTVALTSTNTTTNAFSLTDTVLTTGSLTNFVSTNNSASATTWSADKFTITNAQGTLANTSAGVDVQYTQNTAVAGNTESVLRVNLAANASASTDSTVAALVDLANNDTATGNQITVTDGLKITGTNITSGINLSGTFGTNLITSTNFGVTQAGVIRSQALAINSAVFTDGSNNLTTSGTVGVSQGGTGTSTTFTTGSVVFAGGSGVYTQDNANFFWDDTNNRLGLGDATPTATLTVGADKLLIAGADGDVTFSDDQGSLTFSAADGTNAPMINMFASGTTNGDRMVIAHSPSVTTWGLQYQDVGDKFNFLSSGTVVTTIDLTSQELGVGTSDPENKFHVLKGSAGTVVADGNAIGVFENSTNAYLQILTPAINEQGILFGDPTSSIDGGIIYNNANEMQFRSGGNTTRMTLDASGNLGIGASAPGDLLDVRGAAANARISNTSESESGFAIYDADDTANQYAKLYYDASSTGGNNELNFYVDSSTLSFAMAGTRELIANFANYDSNQVTAPGAPTVAAGAAGTITGTFSYQITFVTANGGETQGGTASSNVTVTSQQINLTGIPTGTTGVVTARRIYRNNTSSASPTVRLLVATLNDNTTTTYTDTMSAGGLSTAFANYVPGNSTASSFSVGGTQRLMIDESGRIGIGTDAPGRGTTNTSTKMELAGADAILRIRNTNDGGGGFIGNTFGSLQFGIYAPTESAFGSVAAAGTQTYFAIDNTGKVGSVNSAFGNPTFRNTLDDGSGNFTFDNSANRTISIAATSSGVAGKSLTIQAGNGTGVASGGALTITSGDDGNSGGSVSSGAISITTPASSDDSGSITIRTGNDGGGVSSFPGDLTLDVGTGTFNFGDVTIGANAGFVTIGNASGFEVTVLDQFDVDNSIELNLTSPAAADYALCHDVNGAHNNAIIYDCNGSVTADYAEIYPVAIGIDYGDILVAGTELVTSDQGNVVPRLVKSTSAYQGKLIGIAVNNYGDFSSTGYEFADTEVTKPVALVGRVTVKVNTENGTINAGDPITTSSTAGVGMKATKPGYIVGYALTSFAGPGQGTVMVFARTEYYVGATLTSDGTLTYVGDTTIWKSQGTADATTQGVNSSAITMRGSGWDGTVAQKIDFSFQTVVTNAGSSKLALYNDAGSEVFSVNQSGDVVVAGRIYPSDRGTAQTSKYIYYDSSASPMDYMRTNASGWATGSYDFAELFPSTDTTLVPGELVAFDPLAPEHIVRARAENKRLLMGIVSTRPGFLAGEWEEGKTKYAVALAGRVPTKVSVENGPIAIGDALTISPSMPGVAVKATNGGTIVGYALEAASQNGTIVVFVRSDYLEPTNAASEQVALQTQSLDVYGTLNLHGGVMTEVASILGANGKWEINSDGMLIQHVAASNGTKNVYASGSPQATIFLFGHGQLVNGEAIVALETVDPGFTSIINPDAPIYVTVTPTTSETNGLYVKSKTPQGFLVADRIGALLTTEFDWTLVAYRRGYAPVVQPMTPPPPAPVPATVEVTPAETTTPTAVAETTTPTAPAESTTPTAPAEVIEPTPAPVAETTTPTAPAPTPEAAPAEVIGVAPAETTTSAAPAETTVPAPEAPIATDPVPAEAPALVSEPSTLPPAETM